MAHISTRTTQFNYFNTVFGGIDWADKKILDFAGNIGTFLLGAPDDIKHEDYWCLDVDQKAIDIGQEQHPKGNFLAFNRYSCFDNCDGEVGLPIPFEAETFDIIIAFSVFNHISKPDMIDLAGQLFKSLKPGGIFGFTYFDKFYDPTQDPDWDMSQARSDLYHGSNLAHRITAYTPLNLEDSLAQAKDARWCTLVHHDFRIEAPDDASPYEQEGARFLQFYDSDYLQSLFPEGEIKKPISPERQHCMILRK